MTAIFRNTVVSIAKTNAWTNPTNSSKAKKGRGAMKGTRVIMTTSKTSPAKTFPKSLNEKEIIFATSLTSSKIPTKNFIGELKLINFFPYLIIPKAIIPKTWVAKTETIASAKVVFKSLFVDLSKGIKELCPPSFAVSKKPIEPIPGTSPSQLERIIKIKIVVTIGKNW